MGTTGFSMANRKTRVGNQPYQDTDEPVGIAPGVPTGPTSEAVQTDPGAAPTVDRAAATTRSTGGTEAPAAPAATASAEPRKRRRGATLASLNSTVDRPSILGN